eukprot:scaffold5756_cov99-Cylindrotheca_fusiformis.AAC.4
MAELMFGLGQSKKKKASEMKVKQYKDTLKNVNITDTAESAIRKDQFTRERDEKATRTLTKANLREVNMALDTVETEVRKEHYNREKQWKATGKQQKEANTSFDMARALFS